MQFTTEKLRDVLVSPGHIDETLFDDAVAKSQVGGMSLTKYLVAHELISNQNLGRAIADGLGYLYFDAEKTRIPDACLSEIPETVMRAQLVVPFEITDSEIKIATANPENKSFFELLEQEKGKHIEVHYTTEENIAEILHYYQDDLTENVKRLATLLKENKDNLENVVEFVDSLIILAYNSHVSDIHIEPHQEGVSVRFRVDGVLHEVISYPKDMHEHLVSRIKILARLRIDEHAVPQDGRFTYQHEDVRVDLRVSLAPISAGENIVMRLLETRSKHSSFEELGISQFDISKIKRAAEKPFGMLLAVGPTGSGKTTTLYVLLEMLNNPEVNIMTIEDPVEYNIEHVQQMQVNQERDLVFSTGLRAIVRQDPDIIMVGEIRDKETADIAINAAMTGHLLLSTMHTNDASTTFPRFAEMEIEPFLSASSLIAIIAQRLVRKICEHCKVSYVITIQELELIRADEDTLHMLATAAKTDNVEGITLYKGKGCSMCGNTGYLGRTGIFEVLEMNDALRAMAVEKKDAAQIELAALHAGMTPMLGDGISKAVQGVTTLIEVIRAVRS